MDFETTVMKIVGVIVALVVALSVTASVRSVMLNSREADTRERAETLLKNGSYTAYLDGEETDGTKLDLEEYAVEINDEKNEVYLTKRQAGRGGSTIFMPLPIYR